MPQSVAAAARGDGGDPPASYPVPVRRCGACGSPSPESLKFCGECGARLPAGGAPDHQERKVVTILFCDLVGFTAASDGADPEDVQAGSRRTPRVPPRDRAVGGTVEKFIGDAVMAAFGAPVARGRRRTRGVAGLELLGAIDELQRADPALGARRPDRRRDR